MHSKSIDSELVNSLSLAYERDQLARLGTSPEQVVDAAESPLIEPDFVLIRSGTLLAFRHAFLAAD